MNCFGPCGDNTCLWILIILLIICCCGTSFIENICNSCYLPVILALLYCVCKERRTVSSLRGMRLRLQISRKHKTATVSPWQFFYLPLKR